MLRTRTSKILAGFAVVLVIGCIFQAAKRSPLRLKEFVLDSPAATSTASSPVLGRLNFYRHDDVGYKVDGNSIRRFQYRIASDGVMQGKFDEGEQASIDAKYDPLREQITWIEGGREAIYQLEK